MRTFAITFTITALAIYLIVSFINLDFSLAYWGAVGRGIYLFTVIFFSSLYSSLQEENK
jgi:hypothetical protein